MRKRHPTSEIWVLKKSRENQSSWSEERTIGISLSQLFYRLDSTVTLPRACSLTPSNSCGELAHKETVLDFVPASRWRDGPGRGAVEWTHSVLYTNCVVETELFSFSFFFFPVGANLLTKCQHPTWRSWCDGYPAAPVQPVSHSTNVRFIITTSTRNDLKRKHTKNRITYRHHAT